MASSVGDAAKAAAVIAAVAVAGAMNGSAGSALLSQIDDPGLEAATSSLMELTGNAIEAHASEVRRQDEVSEDIQGLDESNLAFLGLTPPGSTSTAGGRSEVTEDC
ncbi:hypothetical protein GCM10027259_52050 [Micromonospora palomenae]|uniref:hypothetical protein n=1 Tax=Micromonospora palomenae TaxID=1461247 RepID=UPI0012B8235D|nr:hypothetical protein [Micromonospora palomenae]